MRLVHEVEMLKRKYVQLVLIVWLALLASGCASQKTVVDFVFMRTSDNTQPYWQSVISDFQAANPDIQVNLYVFTWDEGRGKIDEMIKRGKPPALARVATRWIPEYVAAGLVEPVDRYLTDSFRADFIPSLLQQGAQYQGRTFGLPITVSARALYYNKDLFKRAGIDAPPKTWDELRATSLKIHQLGGDVYGFGLQGNLVETNMYFNYFLWGNGGDILTPDGTRAAFDRPQGVEALTYLRDLIRAGATQPDPSQENRAAIETGFVKGSYGMVITGPWLATRLAKEAPTLDYGVAAIPYKTTPATLAAEDTLIVFKQADNKTAAWKFVEFLYQDKYRLDYVTREGVLPEKISTARDPKITGNPITSFFLNQMSTARFEPLNIQSGNIADVMTLAVQAVYQGKAEPQAALQAAAAKVNEMLAYAATSW
jgi:multiple sugar transport system substrate-binding protein